MKVYIVMWADSFDDWELKKVLSTEEKADDYIKKLTGKGYWIMEEEVN